LADKNGNSVKRTRRICLNIGILPKYGHIDSIFIALVGKKNGKRGQVQSGGKLVGIYQNHHGILAENRLKNVSESARRKATSPRKITGLLPGRGYSRS
jgi:hypothetical protein